MANNGNQLHEGHIAVWDGPQLMTSKPEADKFEENGPLNGTTVLQLTITLSRVSTIKNNCDTLITLRSVCAANFV